MARPYFTGNYGSALARVDTSPIIEAGKAQGQMWAGLGGQVGGMIKEYGLNKQKKEKATREVEGSIRMDPTLVGRLTGTGDEAWDKKQNTAIEKLTSGDLNLRGIEGLAGDIARLEKQDNKEQDEAEMRRQIALDLLKREQIGLDMDVKNQDLADAQTLAKVKVTEGEREQNALNQYSSQIHDIAKEVASGTKPEDLSSQDQWLLVNKVAILNGQMPVGSFVVDRNFRMTAAQAKAILEKTKQDIELQDFDIVDKVIGLTDRGKYATIDDVSAELARLRDQGTSANAIRHKSGRGFTLTNVQAVKKQKLTEFDPTNHPGIYSDINNNLYKKDKNGNPVSLGGDKTAQAQGQRLDYLRIKQRQVNDGYLIYKENGKLVDRGSVYDSEPDENTDPNNLYYFYDGKYRKYNQDEEDKINDVEILTELIGSELNFDLDVTP